jgi:hypothetical protein
MSDKLRQFLPQLKKIKKADVKTKRKMIKSYDKGKIDCLCECALNVLKGHVPLKQRQSDCLRRHKRILKKLILKKTPIKQKKKILQTGGFLGALLTPVLSFLASFLGNNATR